MYRKTVWWLMAVWLLTGFTHAAEPVGTDDLSPRSLVQSAYRASKSLNAYTCKLTNITRHRGADDRYNAEKRNVLAYTFRKPGQIRMGWIEPRFKRGQVAVYNHKVLHVSRWWWPFALKVDPDSPTGMDDFHHPIYRSDFASLMGIVVKDMVKVTEEAYEGQVAVGKRRGHRVVLYTAKKRVVLTIDTEHLLPLAIEQYDRESGLLFDGGYFEDLKLNPPLEDSLFDL